MSVRGKWRVVETPEYDMAGPGSYILFARNGGEFALDCLIRNSGERFRWDSVGKAKRIGLAVMIRGGRT